MKSSLSDLAELLHLSGELAGLKIRFSALFNAEFSPQQHKMIVAQAHLL